MKIVIQTSNETVELPDPHSEEWHNPIMYAYKIKPKLEELINSKHICCDGCGRSLINRDWIAVTHRPKSAGEFQEVYHAESDDSVVSYNEYKIKDTWRLFFFCHATTEECVMKWESKRPR